MARNARKTVTSAGQVIGRSGKLRHCTLTISGDRVWELREVNITGNVVYKVNAGLGNTVHQDLDLGFRDALYVKVLSGTTGELQIVYE